MGRTFNIRSLLYIYFNDHLTLSGYPRAKEIIEYMLDQKIDLAYINSLASYCKPVLTSEHWWLEEIELYSSPKESFDNWVNSLIDKYGEWHEVSPITEDYRSTNLYQLPGFCTLSKHRKTLADLDEHCKNILKQEPFFTS